VLFLDDGRLEIDTNIVERGMKGVAIARNYVHPFVMHSSLARRVMDNEPPKLARAARSELHII
jgi:hypothetical protein